MARHSFHIAILDFLWFKWMVCYCSSCGWRRVVRITAATDVAEIAASLAEEWATHERRGD